MKSGSARFDRATLRAIPPGIWALGLVSMLMDVSSEMIHALLPVYLVTVMATSATTVGVIAGVAATQDSDAGARRSPKLPSSSTGEPCYQRGGLAAGHDRALRGRHPRFCGCQAALRLWWSQAVCSS